MAFWRKRKPGPEREVEGQVGWLVCNLCGEHIPLVAFPSITPGGAVVYTREGADEELHMLVAHGMLAN